MRVLRASFWVLVSMVAACSETSPGLDAGPGPDAAARDLQPDQPTGPDAFVPFSLQITVNQIPAAMNGSRTYTALDNTHKSFRLTVPQSGFKVDVSWRGSRADAASLRISASRDLGSGASVLRAGSDLSGQFTKSASGQASWLIPASRALSPGAVTFSATLNEGSTLHSDSVTVDAAARTFLLDPFRLEDTWILAQGFDPKQASAAAADRHNKLTFTVQTMGRLLGALTAHEMGHSLGLVASGPPPYGHFGGEKNASFAASPQTAPGHIDTAGFNIMAAGPGSVSGMKFNILDYLTQPRFNALNLAYLQGRLLLLPSPK